VRNGRERGREGGRDSRRKEGRRLKNALSLEVNNEHWHFTN
jgi:hypothetical protein